MEEYSELARKLLIFSVPFYPILYTDVDLIVKDVRRILFEEEYRKYVDSFSHELKSAGLEKLYEFFSECLRGTDFEVVRHKDVIILFYKHLPRDVREYIDETLKLGLRTLVTPVQRGYLTEKMLKGEVPIGYHLKLTADMGRKLGVLKEREFKDVKTKVRAPGEEVELKLNRAFYMNVVGKKCFMIGEVSFKYMRSAYTLYDFIYFELEEGKSLEEVVDEYADPLLDTVFVNHILYGTAFKDIRSYTTLDQLKGEFVAKLLSSQPTTLTGDRFFGALTGWIGVGEEGMYEMAARLTIWDLMDSIGHTAVVYPWNHKRVGHPPGRDFYQYLISPMPGDSETVRKLARYISLYEGYSTEILLSCYTIGQVEHRRKYGVGQGICYSLAKLLMGAPHEQR